jgi:ABC-type branched-subunit amino acid transport system substrate-binding protein
VVQDDGFGRAYEVDLDKLLASMPEFTVSKAVLNPKTPDYEASVSSLTLAEPTSLLLLANTTHSSAFLLAWKAKQPLPFVMNMAGQANALFANRLKGYTGAAAFVTMTPSPWGGKTAVQRNYQRVAAENKLPLSYLGFEAYMNAVALIETISRSDARTRGDLARYLGNGSTIDLGGLFVEFGDKKSSGGFTDLALLLPDGTYKH